MDNGLPGWWENFLDTKRESQDGNKEFDILEVPWTLFISLMEAKIYFLNIQGIFLNYILKVSFEIFISHFDIDPS